MSDAGFPDFESALLESMKSDLRELKREYEFYFSLFHPLERIAVEIVGRTPLIVHNWSPRR